MRAINRVQGRRHAQVARNDHPLSVGTPFAWWRSDMGITLSAGKVSAWADQISGHPVAQGTAANQPTYTASNASFNGFASLDYDGAGDTLPTSEANSTYDFLGNGNGGSIFAVYSGHDATFSTALAGMFEHYVWLNRVVGDLTRDLAYGTGGSVDRVTLQGTSHATPQWTVSTLSSSLASINASAARASETPGVALANASNSFRIGSAYSTWFQGSIVEVCVYSSALTVAEIAALGRYAAQRYGVSP